MHKRDRQDEITADGGALGGRLTDRRVPRPVTGKAGVFQGFAEIAFSV